MSIMEGGTHRESLNEMNPAHYVGIRELAEYPDGSMPNAVAMVPIVGLFHETCGHGVQYQREFQKDTPLSKVLALNCIACYNTPRYYGAIGADVRKPYFSQPHEIAAQYAGLRSARDFLEPKFGKEHTDRMLCDYVNYRMQRDSEFVKRKKPYDRMDDVFRDFDERFRRCVVFQRRLVDEFPVNSRRITVGEMGYVERGRNGILQDARMASLVLLEEDPYGLIQESIPAVRDMDLSVRNTFSMFYRPEVSKREVRDMTLSSLERALQEAEYIEQRNRGDPEDGMEF